jgi:hypothetical protein
MKKWMYLRIQVSLLLLRHLLLLILGHMLLLILRHMLLLVIRPMLRPSRTLPRRFINLCPRALSA